MCSILLCLLARLAMIWMRVHTRCCCQAAVGTLFGNLQRSFISIGRCRRLERGLVPFKGHASRFSMWFGST